MHTRANFDIGAIAFCVQRAIVALCSSDVATRRGWKPFSASSGPISDGQARELRRHMKRHEAQLLRLSRLAAGKNRYSLEAAQDVYFESFSARICAGLRILHKRRTYASWTEIEQLARELKVREPSSEPVQVTLRPKAKGGWRPIVRQGIERTAQQLVVRDLLQAMGIDSKFDFTRKSAGGEKAYIDTICNDIGKERHWWITADVKNFFPSLKPGHFDWLGIPEDIIWNVLFLPKCAKIRIEYPEKVSRVPSPHILLSELPSKDSLIRLIRQGLPMGAVASPLLARSLLGRELQAIGEREVAKLSYMDDLAIGACSQTDAQIALDALQKRLLSLPAGALELHLDKIRHAPSQGVHALGYRLEPGKGYGENPVHVKPGKPRIERHKQRLAAALAKAFSEEKDLHEVGDAVWERWFNAHPAWTKVPHYSREVSRCAAYGYIDDFKLGIPMGGNAALKYPLGFPVSG